MIQILGLREFVDKKTGEVKLYDSHFNNGWRAPSVSELFANLDQYIEQIPEDQRWNMFYTLARCEEKKGRIFLEQNILPIDIDGIEHGTEDKITECVLSLLKIPKDKVGVVYSGNGIHILIQLPTSFTDVEYFKTNKVYYKALCGRINQALYDAGIKGSADTTAFSRARIFRLPKTANKKPNKPETRCVLINGNIEPLNVDLVTLADLPRVSEGDHVHPNAFKRFPNPDSNAVQTKCPFLVHCKENPNNISEPQWYAMMSIVGRLEDGDKLVHEYSKGYDFYHPDQTDFKLEHALEAAGPRTCENIDSLWDGCRTCPHFCKITSPIQLVGEDFIRTKETGFYDVKVKQGVVVKDKPNYDDLTKFFEQQQPFFTEYESESTYIYNGKYWEEIPRLKLYGFAETHFDPSPSRSMCQEFEAKVKRSNMRTADFTNMQGMLNFENGVLDLETFTLGKHSPDYGFTYVIPYDYEEGKECPRFDKFMMEVTENDEEIAKLLLEYMGYCISGTDPKLVQLCAILYGGGGNGKSVLLEVLRSLIGPQNCSAVGMKSITKDTGRYPMMYKTVNISDETPTSGFLESSDFKALVSGDTVEVRRLYHNPVMWRCTTKLLFACNELPFTADFSQGLFRRLLIIPFNARFSHEKGNLDPFIVDKLLAERSGILHKVLSAFKDLKAREYKFIVPEKISDTKEDYEYMGDSVLQFVSEECFVKEGNKVTMRLAYRVYVSWCQDVNIKPVTYNSFARAFKNRLNKVHPKNLVWDVRRDVGTKKERIFTNLAIGSEATF
jgi:P4 family phage/plasmid primase-like protien